MKRLCQQPSALKFDDCATAGTAVPQAHDIANRRIKKSPGEMEGEKKRKNG